ncbi:uncharacterized protein LOC128548432 [Mercenaria mercenaria]|uniref:uncharacterized protein LOC128548432 n=1 Tax=Mercenaria mercenaria TaxID=6596 RepID=UPI00234EFBDC|nr:uncharacterized protein LOC128548432 [Mercenaria mercenaria]
MWPPGPFAIPMSKYGCPESQSRGWSKGVLKVNLATQNNRTIDYKGNNLFPEITNNSRSQKLKFCVKTRNDPTLDKGRWISGKYSIYKKGEGCPLGFEELNRTIFYSEYETYGQLPNHEVLEEEHFDNYITMTMCGRSNITDLEVADTMSAFGMLKTIFMLIRARYLSQYLFDLVALTGRINIIWYFANRTISKSSQVVVN